MRQDFKRNLFFDGFFFSRTSVGIYITKKKEFQQFSISHEIQNHQVDPLYLAISIENLNHCHDNQMMGGGKSKGHTPHNTIHILAQINLHDNEDYLITRKASKMFFLLTLTQKEI